MYWPGGIVHPQALGVDFDAPSHADSAHDLPLRFKLQETEERTFRAVHCFYRNAHQALDFEETEMQAHAGGIEAVIPGTSIDVAWDLMIFFELRFGDGTATRWPDWRNGTPYLVIPTR